MKGGPAFNPHRAFTKGPKKPRAARSEPEQGLQVQIKKLLIIALPPGIEWSATLNGVRLTPRTLQKMTAAGLRKGPLDLVFVSRCWTRGGRSKWIELKWGNRTTTAEQKVWLDILGPDDSAGCRTAEEVMEALTGWGAKLRPVTIY